MPPPIWFYLQEKIPAEVKTPWEAYQLAVGGMLRHGFVAWTVQTYFHLRQAGFPCELTNTIPTEGILVAHRKSLPRNFVPPEGVLFVCIRADATFHPYAHLHVVQNPEALSAWFPSVYIPLWLQPGLLPRDPSRGDTWVNACYFGEEAVTKEMQGPAWEEQLRSVGLKWHIVGPQGGWHDFRETDVVVAIRGFDRHRRTNKPPSKLFNAWHAGVPAVLGCETAYQAERKSPLDYIEVRSFAEVIAALRRLQADPALRRAMSENGFDRAKESTPAAMTARWREFLEGRAVPAYEGLRRKGNLKRAVFRGNGLLKTVTLNLRELIEG